MYRKGLRNSVVTFSKGRRMTQKTDQTVPQLCSFNILASCPVLQKMTVFGILCQQNVSCFTSKYRLKMWLVQTTYKRTGHWTGNSYTNDGQNE